MEGLHYFATFGGHKYCSSRDILFLGCHVIKQEHVMKGSCDYDEWTPQAKSPPC